jgi:hypothetical protein
MSTESRRVWRKGQPAGTGTDSIGEAPQEGFLGLSGLLATVSFDSILSQSRLPSRIAPTDLQLQILVVNRALPSRHG